MFLDFIKRWLGAKPATKQHYTGEAVSFTDQAKIIKKRLLKQLRQLVYSDKTMTHSDVALVARMFFGVADFPDAAWRIRYGKGSLMYFRVKAINPKFIKGQLHDLELCMVDDSLGSNLRLVISIRELWEMMEPVPVKDIGQPKQPTKAPH